MKKLILIIAVLVIALVLVSLFVVLVVFNPPSVQMQLNDPRGDVLLSFGSGYPNVVDILGASFERTGNTGNFSILVNEGASTLSQGQTVIWEITLIFENSTDEVVGLHTLQIVLNSTGYFGSVTTIEDGNSTDFNINRDGNLISAITNFTDLQDSDKVEWSVTATYEAEEGDDLVANAFDFVPDEGTYITNFS